MRWYRRVREKGRGEVTVHFAASRRVIAASRRMTAASNIYPTAESTMKADRIEPFPSPPYTHTWVVPPPAYTAYPHQPALPTNLDEVKFNATEAVDSPPANAIVTIKTIPIPDSEYPASYIAEKQAWQSPTPSNHAPDITLSPPTATPACVKGSRTYSLPIILRAPPNAPSIKIYVPSADHADGSSWNITFSPGLFGPSPEESVSGWQVSTSAPGPPINSGSGGTHVQWVSPTNAGLWNHRVRDLGIVSNVILLERAAVRPVFNISGSDIGRTIVCGISTIGITIELVVYRHWCWILSWRISGYRLVRGELWRIWLARATCIVEGRTYNMKRFGIFGIRPVILKSETAGGCDAGYILTLTVTFSAERQFNGINATGNEITKGHPNYDFSMAARYREGYSYSQAVSEVGLGFVVTPAVNRRRNSRKMRMSFLWRWFAVVILMPVVSAVPGSAKAATAGDTRTAERRHTHRALGPIPVSEDQSHWSTAPPEPSIHRSPCHGTIREPILGHRQAPVSQAAKRGKKHTCHLAGLPLQFGGSHSTGGTHTTLIELIAGMELSPPSRRIFSRGTQRSCRLFLPHLQRLEIASLLPGDHLLSVLPSGLENLACICIPGRAKGCVSPGGNAPGAMPILQHVLGELKHLRVFALEPDAPERRNRRPPRFITHKYARYIRRLKAIAEEFVLLAPWLDRIQMYVGIDDESFWKRWDVVAIPDETDWDYRAHLIREGSGRMSQGPSDILEEWAIIAMSEIAIHGG
ncbi:hypothetical protein C8R44DRAFT_751083 [Mycena epipterygia]|nr:hypothetical protein C8R44DRAFT_751083 [Mycena epipterygia]